MCFNGTAGVPVTLPVGAAKPIKKPRQGDIRPSAAHSVFRLDRAYAARHDGTLADLAASGRKSRHWEVYFK
jgi:hypothetical protein